MKRALIPAENRRRRLSMEPVILNWTYLAGKSQRAVYSERVNEQADGLMRVA